MHADCRLREGAAFQVEGTLSRVLLHSVCDPSVSRDSQSKDPPRKWREALGRVRVRAFRWSVETATSPSADRVGTFSKSKPLHSRGGILSHGDRPRPSERLLHSVHFPIHCRPPALSPVINDQAHGPHVILCRAAGTRAVPPPARARARAVRAARHRGGRDFQRQVVAAVGSLIRPASACERLDRPHDAVRNASRALFWARFQRQGPRRSLWVVPDRP
jgi:hypothetical protein